MSVLLRVASFLVVLVRCKEEVTIPEPKLVEVLLANIKATTQTCRRRVMYFVIFFFKIRKKTKDVELFPVPNISHPTTQKQENTEQNRRTSPKTKGRNTLPKENTLPKGKHFTKRKTTKTTNQKEQIPKQSTKENKTANQKNKNQHNQTKKYPKTNNQKENITKKSTKQIPKQSTKKTEQPTKRKHSQNNQPK